MIIAHTIKDLESFFEAHSGVQIGFVPTMGALHKGHLSLVKSAKQHSDVVVVSIFVNPLQFNDPADFKKYPVTIESDISLLTDTQCDLLFLPSYDEVYPAGFSSVVLPLDNIDNILEGASRKGHFDGVVQVLHRLFSIVSPTHAFFGLKDFQQCLVVKKLCDAFFPSIQLHFLPTMRMESGLAMSSRNTRLSEEGLNRAAAISKTLFAIKSLMNAYPPDAVADILKNKLSAFVDSIDYLVIVDPQTLSPILSWDSNKNYIILTAVFIEGVRLIDNFEF